MAKVPSRLHAAAKDALKLAGGDAFFAAGKQVDRLKPKPQGQMAILEDGADTNSELLAAGRRGRKIFLA